MVNIIPKSIRRRDLIGHDKVKDSEKWLPHTPTSIISLKPSPIMTLTITIPFVHKPQVVIGNWTTWRASEQCLLPWHHNIPKGFYWCTKWTPAYHILQDLWFTTKDVHTCKPFGQNPGHAVYGRRSAGGAPSLDVTRLRIKNKDLPWIAIFCKINTGWVTGSASCWSDSLTSMERAFADSKIWFSNPANICFPWTSSRPS